ncbi:MAG: hypothetical protein HGA75_06375 [Thiobacillus sp.]|nr:hypothetical protein [Thiobacillus sp.]
MGLLNRLFGGQGIAERPELPAAIERAVDLVEPMLRQVGGYPERYRRAVAHALDYAFTLAGQLPGPVRVSREDFAGDALVHALFASPDDIHAALCMSQAMRDYRHDSPDAGEVYALMCMRRGTKAMLGMAMDGEVLRRDVPQQAVYFTDHTLADAGRDEALAREHIAWGLFDSLAKHVRLRIEARKQTKRELEQERDECLARLRGTAATRRGELETSLQRILHRLGEAAGSLDLSRYGDDFEAVFLAPERHVYIERTRMTLDSMGLLTGSADGGGTEIEFCDLVGRDRRRWTVVVMYCDQVQQEGGMGERFLMAQRWLGL